MVNLAPYSTGTLPTFGPHLLLDAGVPLFEAAGSGMRAKIRDGKKVTVTPAGEITVGRKAAGTAQPVTRTEVDATFSQAQRGLVENMEAYFGNTIEFIHSEAALLIDGVLILGFYALFGLEITPAMIIGFLTVLTFSLYDTVIVFDKVRENTAGILDSRRSTYAEEANLAVNQTVMRSISTSVISALPIIALMVVAVWMLGVGTLRDLAVIQLVGVIEGIFSSLFLATPLLVSIVNREKKYKEHNAEVEAYRSGSVEEEEEPVVVEKRQVAAPVSRAAGETRATGSSTWRPTNRG